SYDWRGVIVRRAIASAAHRLSGSRHGDCTVDRQHESGVVVPRSPRSIIIGSLVAVTRLAGAQTDSNAGQTFYVQRDALVGTALFAVSAGVSLFDVRIARYFQDTTLRHVRVGRRLDGAFTRINETTLTVGGLVVYAAARIAKQRTLADAAFHVAESV